MVAAGDRNGTISFARHPIYRGSSVAGLEVHSGRAVVDGYETIHVPLRTVDSLLPAALPIRLVKIDVEGGEAQVLRGLRPAVEAGRVDAIVTEVLRSTSGGNWPLLVEELENLAYQGARFATLSSAGHTHPIELSDVVVRWHVRATRDRPGLSNSVTPA